MAGSIINNNITGHFIDTSGSAFICDGDLKPALKRTRLEKEVCEFPWDEPSFKRRCIQQEGYGISVSKTEPFTLVPDPQVDLFNAFVEEMRNNISLKKYREVEQQSPILLSLLQKSI